MVRVTSHVAGDGPLLTVVMSRVGRAGAVHHVPKGKAGLNTKSAAELRLQEIKAVEKASKSFFIRVSGL